MATFRWVGVLGLSKGVCVVTVGNVGLVYKLRLWLKKQKI